MVGETAQAVRLVNLEKQMKDHQSDKDSMVNHDPEASEDDRDSAQDGEVIFLRERVESYEVEIERLRSESIAREGEKRRLAEMVKSLNDNRSGASDAGAREERVSFEYIFNALGWLTNSVSGHVERYVGSRDCRA